MECVECLYFDSISERCTLRDNCVYDEESNEVQEGFYGIIE